MVHNLQNLQYYIDKCGSRYSATVFVSRLARQLVAKYQDVISFAEALTWILSGEVPKNVLQYRQILRRREERFLGYAKDTLSTIWDEDVKQSVLESLVRSRKAGHLIYHYEGVYDSYRQSRVRILTRKIWNEIREELDT